MILSLFPNKDGIDSILGEEYREVWNSSQLYFQIIGYIGSYIYRELLKDDTLTIYVDQSNTAAIVVLVLVIKTLKYRGVKLIHIDGSAMHIQMLGDLA